MKPDEAEMQERKILFMKIALIGGAVWGTIVLLFLGEMVEYLRSISALLGIIRP